MAEVEVGKRAAVLMRGRFRWPHDDDERTVSMNRRPRFVVDRAGGEFHVKPWSITTEELNARIDAAQARQARETRAALKVSAWSPTHLVWRGAKCYSSNGRVIGCDRALLIRQRCKRFSRALTLPRTIAVLREIHKRCKLYADPRTQERYLWRKHLRLAEDRSE